MRSRFVLLFAVCLSSGCQRHSLEEDFLAGPSGNRLERMENYNLEDQYKIFRYANEAEPPDIELAEAIAKQGKVAVPFLEEQLRADTDDVAVRDLLQVFYDMQRSGSYNVGGDGQLMLMLQRSVERVEKRPWGPTCQRILSGIQATSSILEPKLGKHA